MNAACGSEQENTVLLHRTARLPVGEASRSAIDDVAPLGDQNDGPHDPPVCERVIDGSVKPSSQIVMVVIGKTRQ